FDALEKHMENSKDKIIKGKINESTRKRVIEAFKGASTEEALCENLRKQHIDLFLRRNDAGRITGVTFIDHNERCVLNGSRLGKEFSANQFESRFNTIIPTLEKINQQAIKKTERGRKR
ncbi:FMN-binding protein, partial [Bacteroidales bacterium OttesenSCG-928-J19]|nr:FMN-binding protein [Bacteroidales bacterium OttesenSCG-928-J19]